MRGRRAGEEVGDGPSQGSHGPTSSPGPFVILGRMTKDPGDEVAHGHKKRKFEHRYFRDFLFEKLRAWVVLF